MTMINDSFTKVVRQMKTLTLDPQKMGDVFELFKHYKCVVVVL